MRVMRIAATLLAGAFVVGAGTVWAQDREALLKARQAPMEALTALVSDMKKAVEGNQDLKPFESRVETTIESLKPFRSLFPVGTGPDSGLKTCALQGVWSKPTEFEQGHVALLAQLVKLRGALQGSDASAMRAEYTATGRACSACHGRSAEIAKWPPC